MNAQVRSCGSSAWSTDAGELLETNWLSGSIPVYDVHATGYPPRMREWTRRKSEAERAGKQSAD